MMKKTTIALSSAALTFLLSFAAQMPEKPPDVWLPFRFFVGQWEGRGEGQPGISHGRQEWQFVLGGKYLQIKNEARFDPHEKNPRGEVHEDWGFISYDRMRKAYVFRQFHVEGFVNQYVCPGPDADGKTFVFLSEAIENMPPGFKARLTYRILDDIRFEQTFDLAPPGREMACYSKGVMIRKGVPRPAAKERKKSLRTSPNYEASFSLDATSPFVPDGRHSLAEISCKVFFPSVTFEFDPEEDPLLGRCQVNADKGKGTFSKLILNDAQKGEERLSPGFLSARPLEFTAGLAIESEPMPEEEAALHSRTAPAKVRLSFWTEWEPTPIRWGSKFGSGSLPDLKIVFEVPFHELLQGKPFSVTVPHEGLHPEDKGYWKINFRPALKKKYPPNTLTAEEKAQGWRLLFNGRDFTNWRGVGSETIPERLWSVKDGMISKEDVPGGATLPDGQPVLGGDIITRETFLDFEFAFEWKVEKGANSGVKYNVDENLTSDGRPSRATLGFEYQVIDNIGFAEPLTPKQTAGSLYDLVPAAPGNAALPAGEWNRSRIVFQGTRIEHWLNGVKVVETDTASESFKTGLAGSKFAKIDGFARKKKGHISLQDHNGAYVFRSLKIREIPPKMEPQNADMVSTAEAGKRIGIIGLDTSHAPAFARIFNSRNASAEDYRGFRVVAAYPQGSRDIESSTSRVPGYTQDMREMKVEIVNSIPALLQKVDFVLLTSNDGRVHLEQALPVIEAGKPLYVDKPMAASLADVIAIFEAAEAKTMISNQRMPGF